MARRSSSTRIPEVLLCGGDPRKLLWFWISLAGSVFCLTGLIMLIYGIVGASQTAAVHSTHGAKFWIFLWIGVALLICGSAAIGVAWNLRQHQNRDNQQSNNDHPLDLSLDRTRGRLHRVVPHSNRMVVIRPSDLQLNTSNLNTSTAQPIDSFVFECPPSYDEALRSPSFASFPGPVATSTLRRDASNISATRSQPTTPIRTLSLHQSMRQSQV